LELVDQHAERRRHRDAAVRRHCCGDILRSAFPLPQPGLEEAGVENVLELRLAERFDARRVGKELHEQRHAEVGHSEVLQQELRVAAREATAEGRELLVPNVSKQRIDNM
jgi:hypothetical protein